MFNYKVTMETINLRTITESNDVNALKELIDSYIDATKLVDFAEGEFFEINLVDNNTGEVYFYYIVEGALYDVITRTYKSDFYREYFC